MIDGKALPIYDPYSPDPRHKAILYKTVSRNSCAPVYERSLPFSVCRCPTEEVSRANRTLTGNSEVTT